jgi:hypothetical protein
MHSASRDGECSRRNLLMAMFCDTSEPQSLGSPSQRVGFDVVWDMHLFYLKHAGTTEMLTISNT